MRTLAPAAFSNITCRKIRIHNRRLLKEAYSILISHEIGSAIVYSSSLETQRSDESPPLVCTSLYLRCVESILFARRLRRVALPPRCTVPPAANLCRFTAILCHLAISRLRLQSPQIFLRTTLNSQLYAMRHALASGALPGGQLGQLPPLGRYISPGSKLRPRPPYRLALAMLPPYLEFLATTLARMMIRR
jgi:hypothetical protein